MTPRLDQRLRRLGLYAFWVIAAVVFVLSLVPMNPGAGLPGNDKLRHLSAYALLIFPVTLFARSALTWALPLAFAMGAAVELLQPLTGRSREMADMVANVTGLAIGVAAGLVLARLWFGRRGT